jgi:hypothetical protein
MRPDLENAPSKRKTHWIGFRPRFLLELLDRWSRSGDGCQSF